VGNSFANSNESPYRQEPFLSGTGVLQLTGSRVVYDSLTPGVLRYFPYYWPQMWP
jgi:hypothetical protein